MLSMVSVDVVSGDATTCGLHLGGCASLIGARRAAGGGAGGEASARTRALHRIFFYLRVMRDATALACGGFRASAALGGDDDDDEIEACLDPYEPPVEDERLDSSSYELIYGLPRSLLVLVHRTCRLLRKMNRVEATAAFPPALMRLCDQLEDEILEWPVEEEVARLRRMRLDRGNCSILQHHIRAFHGATIIFFCRNVRLMDKRHLQQYVKGVVGHLVEVETIKQREMISANPLLWPAFVAGEQAIDHSTREQLVHWFDVVEQHGVATAKLTRASLEEIWQRSGQNRAAGPVGVLHTQLMLT